MASPEQDGPLFSSLLAGLENNFDTTLAFVTKAVAEVFDPSTFVDEICSFVDGSDISAAVSPETRTRIDQELLPQVLFALCERPYYSKESVGAAHNFLATFFDKAISSLCARGTWYLPALACALDPHRDIFENARDVSLSAKVGQFTKVNGAAKGPNSFLNLVEHFGSVGGFTALIDLVRKSTSITSASEDGGKLSTDSLLHVFRIVYGVKSNLHSDVLRTFMVALTDTTRKLLQHMSEKFFAQETLMEIVRISDLVLMQLQQEAIMSDGLFGRTLATSVQLLELQTHWSSFCGGPIDKQVAALTEISSVVTQLYNTHVMQMTSSDSVDTVRRPSAMIVAVLTWMADVGMVDTLLQDRIHPQLLRRSAALFQFLTDTGNFTPSHVDLLWKLYDRDEATSSSIHELWLNLVDFMDRNLLELMCVRVQTSKMDANHLSLLATIATRDVAADPMRDQGTEVLTLRKQILSHLIQSATEKSDLAELSLKYVDSVLRRVYQDNSVAVATAEASMTCMSDWHALVQQLLTQCTRMLKEDKDVMVPLKMITYLISLLVEKACWESPDSCISHAEVTQLAKESIALFSSARTNALAIDEESRVAEVKTHLLVLRALWLLESCFWIADYLRESSMDEGRELFPSTGREMVEAVWTHGVENAESADEASLSFQWLELCATTSLPFALASSDESIPLLPTELAEEIVEKKFTCLRGSVTSSSALSCFHHLFRRINLAAGGLESYLVSTQDEDIVNSEAAEQVVDLVSANPLVGLDALWLLSLHTSDVAVAEEAFALLIGYHLEFIPSLQTTGTPLMCRLRFVETCMDHLTSAKARLAENPEMHEMVINRCIDLLHHFLISCENEAEEEGAATTRFEKLEEQLSIMQIFPSPLKSQSNMPNSSASTQQFEYSKSRKELVEEIEEESMPPPAPTDVDVGPRPSPRKKGYIPPDSADTDQELLSEALDASGSPLVSPNKRPTLMSPPKRVKVDLQYASSSLSPRKGPNMSSDDFNQALRDVVSDPLAPKSLLKTERTLSKSEVASHVLANEGNHFSCLMELMDLGESTARRVWELLTRLPINHNILHKVINRKSADGSVVEWSQLLRTDNLHHLLYVLRVIEALLIPLHPISEDVSSTSPSDHARRVWRERFIRLDGASCLYSIVFEWKDNRSESGSRGVYEENLYATCLASIMHTMAYLTQLLVDKSIHESKADKNDVRLFESTLPDMEEHLDTPLLLKTIAEHVDMFCNKTVETNCRASSSEASRVICTGFHLVCLLYAHEPTLLLDNPSSIHHLVYRAMAGGQSVETDVRPEEAMLQLAIRLQTQAEINVDALNAVLQAVVDTTLDAVNMLTFGSGDNIELHPSIFALFSQVLESVKMTPDAQAWTVQYMSSCALPQKILDTLDIVTSGNANTCADSSQDAIACLLSSLLALQGLSSSICSTILNHRTPEVDTEALVGNCWTLDLLTKRLLLGSSSERTKSGNFASYAVLPACNTEKCRRLCQQLLLTLAFDLFATESVALHSVLDTMDTYQSSVLDTLNVSGRPWNYEPNDALRTKSKSTAYAGLVNPGCICYMSSLLQQLYMLAPFRDGLLTLDTRQLVQLDVSGTTREEVEQLQKLFVSLALTTYRAYDPSEFALSHTDVEGNRTDLRTQMDADEFFCLLLDRLETCVNKANDGPNSASTFLSDCFGGQLVTQVITEQGNVSEREEKFYALSLDVAHHQRMEDSLASYVESEKLDGENAYFCEAEQRKVSASKRICVKKLPHTLVFHLKRFEFDFETMERMKINEYLSFPDEIDMYPYTSEGLSSSDEENAGKSDMYDLVGVVVHSGSSDVGHYYSFIKDRSGAQGEWLEFNDDVVRAFDIDTLGEECFGGEEHVRSWNQKTKELETTVQMKRRSAYMLIYEQRSWERQNVKTGSAAIESALESGGQNVQKYAKQTMAENLRFQQIVNSFDPIHADFLRSLVNRSVPSESSSGIAVDVGNGIPPASTKVCQLVCSYMFGVSVLRPKDSVIDRVSVLEKVYAWVHSWNVLDNQRREWSEWLLQRIVSSPSEISPAAALELSDAECSTVTRSWLADVLLVESDDRVLTEMCFKLLRTAFVTLIESINAEQSAGETNSDDESESTAVSTVCMFMTRLLDLFYTGNEARMMDMTSGNIVRVSERVVHESVMHIGNFLENIICSPQAQGQSSKYQSTLRSVLVRNVDIVNRVLIELQNVDEEGENDGRGYHYPIHPAKSLEEERSDYRSMERESGSPTAAFEVAVLNEVLLHEPSSALGDKESKAAIPDGCETILDWIDTKVVLNQATLYNMFKFGLDQALMPVLVAVAAHGSRNQRATLVSLLMAIMDDVKTQHLDQIFLVLNAVLEPEERSSTEEVKNGGKTGSTSEPSDAPDVTEVHEHVFSPSHGIFEAAAYYRNHAVHHEYTFRLLEYAIIKGNESSTARYVIQNGPDMKKEMAWIKPWLLEYVDPKGAITNFLNTSSMMSAGTEESSLQNLSVSEEDAGLYQQVEVLLRAAEKAFGVAFLHNNSNVKCAFDVQLTTASKGSAGKSDNGKSSSKGIDAADDENQDRSKAMSSPSKFASSMDDVNHTIHLDADLINNREIE